MAKKEGLMTYFILISIAILGGAALWAAFIQNCPYAQKSNDLIIGAFAILGLVEMWQTMTLSIVEEVITAAGRASVYLFLVTEISPYNLVAYISAALIVGLAIYAAMKREGRI